MAAPQQYSLRWNNYSQHIVNALDDLRSDDELTDVTLSCEGQRIKAHKILLSACSNYFRETFRENPCKHPIVILKGVNIADLRAVVTFMYNGQVNVSQDRLQSFLHTAELLQIKGLTDMNDKDEPPKKRPVNNTSSLHNNQDSSRLSSGDGAARPPTPKRKRPVQPGFANETSAASPSTNNSASAGGSNGVGPSTSNSGLITADGVVVPTITSVTSNASTSSNHSQNNMTQDDSYPNIGVVKFEDDDMQDEDDYEDKILSSEDNDNSVQDMLQVDQSGIGSFMGASGGQPGLSSATESSSHVDRDENAQRKKDDEKPDADHESDSDNSPRHDADDEGSGEADDARNCTVVVDIEPVNASEGSPASATATLEEVISEDGEMPPQELKGLQDALVEVSYESDNDVDGNGVADDGDEDGEGSVVISATFPPVPKSASGRSHFQRQIESLTRSDSNRMARLITPEVVLKEVEVDDGKVDQGHDQDNAQATTHAKSNRNDRDHPSNGHKGLGANFNVSVHKQLRLLANSNRDRAAVAVDRARQLQILRMRQQQQFNKRARTNSNGVATPSFSLTRQLLEAGRSGFNKYQTSASYQQRMNDLRLGRSNNSNSKANANANGALHFKRSRSFDVTAAEVTFSPLNPNDPTPGPYICNLCGKIYQHHRSLNDHQKFHTGETRCPICKKLFSKVANMRAHYAIQHVTQFKDRVKNKTNTGTA